MARRERVVCSSDALVEGGAGVRFEISPTGDPVPAFAVRWHGVVRAYVNECRHQASQLDWTPGDFLDESKLYLICATHGALYEPDSGLCVAGPCRGARLCALDVTERDGAVLLVEV